MKDIQKILGHNVLLPSKKHTNNSLIIHDIVLVSIIMILAGCGIIYEFLLSHYAARVLGMTEVAIFGVFTIMIASMGVGSFAARKLSCPFTGFVYLELLIALIGVSAILIIASCITFTHLLPTLIAETYGIYNIYPTGGLIHILRKIAQTTPYIFAFLLGALVGAEIPLVARIREKVYGMHMENNTGTIYGMDYIGAGIGATLFVFYLLTMEVTQASVIVAFANLFAGILFLYKYKTQIKTKIFLVSAHIFVGATIITILLYGSNWETHLEEMLYKDQVIYSMNTKYQRIVITKRIMNPDKSATYSLHINGHTQFSSRDENIYHSMLVYPAMLASARHDKVLIIGGGDGLALRDVLKWSPKDVTLVDLDEQLISFFSKPMEKNGVDVNYPLLMLNNWSFSDDRVRILIGDAFTKVDDLLQSGEIFDTVIVDLPDPNHPDLNKLYSARFYTKLFHLLSGDGAMTVQSTSPYHAKEAFISIGKTIRNAGFGSVEQYHTNIPSFGEWGWSIATKIGLPATQRIRKIDSFTVPDNWITKAFILSAFSFNKNYYQDQNQIKINRLGNSAVYEYHRLGWAREFQAN